MVSTSVVATALPTIVGELGGQEQFAWVASAALLTMTASTPLWGKLSDLYGRKLMFQSALAIFVLGSMAAGLSQGIGMLIAARAIQGLGAGGISALVQVVLGDVVEPRERGRYAGVVGGVFGVATVAGPLLGGFIVDASWLGWRWCFYVCVPLAAIAFVVIQKVLNLPRNTRDARIDWLGAFAITGGASTLMLLLSLGGKEFAWNSGWTYGLAVLVAALVALAIGAERRVREPILPPRLFRNRTFVLASLSSLFLGVAMFGAMIFLPQYLQIVRGMRPTASGLMTLPMVLGMFLASLVTGRLVSRTGRWKIYPMVGLALVASALFLLSHLHVDTPYAVIGVDIALLGSGLGMSMQNLILAAQNAAALPDMAVTTSGVSFFRSLGGSMGVAGFGALMTDRLSSGLAERLSAARLPLPAGGVALGSPDQINGLGEPLRHMVLESFTEAMQTVFLVGVPIALLGLVMVFALKELPLRSARQVPEPKAVGVEPVPEPLPAVSPRHHRSHGPGRHRRAPAGRFRRHRHTTAAGVRQSR
ncbi:MFS transporter [Actinomadura craniellae]|uniref:MFS transporter n=2 Tax=Actinomadura craniellae TaxID=2231787 RepID=A0A365H8R9_9ACTN|nr:MFS transporter [Actinomadura craniellae]